MDGWAIIETQTHFYSNNQLHKDNNRWQTKFLMHTLKYHLSNRIRGTMWKNEGNRLCEGSKRKRPQCLFNTLCISVTHTISMTLQKHILNPPFVSIWYLHLNSKNIIYNFIHYRCKGIIWPTISAAPPHTSFIVTLELRVLNQSKWSTL